MFSHILCIIRIFYNIFAPSDKDVEKARIYLKDNGLLAVPFDKGVGFCVMKKETYEKKLKDFFTGRTI